MSRARRMSGSLPSRNGEPNQMSAAAAAVAAAAERLRSRDSSSSSSISISIIMRRSTRNNGRTRAARALRHLSTFPSSFSSASQLSPCFQLIISASAPCPTVPAWVRSTLANYYPLRDSPRNPWGRNRMGGPGIGMMDIRYAWRAEWSGSGTAVLLCQWAGARSLSVSRVPLSVKAGSAGGVVLGGRGRKGGQTRTRRTGSQGGRSYLHTCTWQAELPGSTLAKHGSSLS